RFYCKSDNREFAYAVIHPQMMEWMLSLGQAKLRFEGQLGDGLFVSDITRMPERAEAKQAAFAMAAGFINRIPPFVWKDYGKRDAMKLPEPQSAPVARAPLVAAGDGQRDPS